MSSCCADLKVDQIWVCEECKKKNNELILLKFWKLIGRSVDSEEGCELCGEPNGTEVLTVVNP